MLKKPCNEIAEIPLYVPSHLSFPLTPLPPPSLPHGVGRWFDGWDGLMQPRYGTGEGPVTRFPSFLPERHARLCLLLTLYLAHEGKL